MNNLKYLLLKFILINIFFLTPSYGYFDPGIGSMLLQTFIAIIAYITLTLNSVRNYFKNIYYKLFQKHKKPLNKEKKKNQDE